MLPLCQDTLPASSTQPTPGGRYDMGALRAALPEVSQQPAGEQPTGEQQAQGVGAMDVEG